MKLKMEYPLRDTKYPLKDTKAFFRGKRFVE